jgi:ELWxxDGT repeat protein
MKLRRKRKAQRSVQLALELMEDRTVPAHAIAVGPDLSLIGPGPNSGTKIGETLYFLAHQSTDATGVSDIWQVSGTATAQEVNVPALAGMSIDEIENVGSTLYVTASAAPSAPPPMLPTNQPDVNLWKIDPTAPGGAVELTNFTGSGAANLQAVDNKLFFEHSSFTGFEPSQSGNELWVTDGTTAGTQMAYAFSGSSYPMLTGSAAAGGDLYFRVASFVSPASPAVWVSDGTAAGTQAITAVGGSSVSTPTDFSLTTLGNAVYFGASDGVHAQLWRAENGQASIVQSFDSKASSSFVPTISGMTAANGNVYFALDRGTGAEVWASDGTTAGTSPVYQPPSGVPPVLPPPVPGVPGFPGPTTPYVGDIAVMNGSVYFTLVNGGGLMKADGQGGASPVPLPAGLTPSASLTAIDNRLYFQADDGVHGNELWTTDGTAGGAVRLTDINPGSGSTFPLGPEAAGGALYVLATDGVPSATSFFAPEKLWMLPDPAAPAGAAATTALQAASPGVAIGGSVTLTATVTQADPSRPAPTGNVVFRDDAQVYGSAPLVNGTASLPVTISLPGAHTLEAIYTGDSVYDESISAPVTVTAGPSGTTLGLTTSDATADPGQSLTFTATITPALSAPQQPTGSVTFFDGTTFLGTSVVSAGVATYQTSTLTNGIHNIGAVYSGDMAFSPSSSAPLTETVGPKFTVALSAPPASTTLGQPLALTAQVTPAAGGSVPSGMTVLFRDAATPLGSASVNASGVATLTISNLGVGAHSLSAVVFNGGAEFDSAAAAVTVQRAATTASLRSTAPTARLGQPVTLTMTIAPPGPGLPAPTGTVTFRDGSVIVGTATVANGRAVLLVSNLALGSHAITASYGGDANYTGSTATLSQTVTPLNVATTIAIQPAVTTAIVGDQVALTATVTPAVGTATPDGSVTFRDGAALLGAVKIDPTGHALLLTSTLGTGNHTITATFGGAGIFTGSASAPVTVAIRLGATAHLAEGEGAIVSGQGVALTATVSAMAGGAIQPAGNVTFYDGATALGTSPLQNGIAKFTTPSLATVATHRLTAVYNGNGLFAATTTNAVYLSVRSIGTRTTLQTPAPPAAGTGHVTIIATVAVQAPGTGPATGSVAFYDGTTPLGSANVSGGTAVLHLANLPAGGHYLRAVFNGTGNFSGSSSAIVHYAIAATTSTTLHATAAAFGQTTTLKAIVTALSPGFGKANGKVLFIDGNTVIGSANLLNGIASIGVKLSTGSHNLAATYVGNSDFAASSAVPIAYVVSKSSPALSLKATPVNPKAGANVTLHVDIDPATAGAAAPTGSILITNGSTIIGVGTIVHGTVVIQTTKLTKGTHALTATYAGDVNYVAAMAHLSLIIG